MSIFAKTDYLPQPAHTYQEALTRVQTLLHNERPDLNNQCKAQLLTHGQRTEKAILLIHGYTNCPQQFCQLAPMLHAKGYNVYSSRLPKHGLADRVSPEQGKLRAQQLLRAVHQMVDLVRGLGKEITVLGFSLGGVLAAWIAQQRADVDHVVLVSPSLSLHAVPMQRRALYGNVLTLLPNFFRWWDEEAKDARIGPLHAYPRMASRGIAAILRLSTGIEKAARRSHPQAKRITVITNPNDDTVDNTGAVTLAQLWRQHGATVQHYEFPAEWKLIHDLMDPAQPEQQVARVYPQLIEWLETHSS